MSPASAFSAATHGARLDFLTYRNHLAARLIACAPTASGWSWFRSAWAIRTGSRIPILTWICTCTMWRCPGRAGGRAARPHGPRHQSPPGSFTAAVGDDLRRGAGDDRRGAAGSFALIGKVHHAAIDGLSGGAMLGVMLDPTPDPGQAPAAMPWQPATVPIMGSAGAPSLDYLRWPCRVSDLLSATARSAVKIPFVPHVEGVESLPRLYAAPHTRLTCR